MSILNDKSHTPVIVTHASNLERSEFRIDPDNFVLRPKERMAVKLLFAPKVREYMLEPAQCFTVRPVFSESTMRQAKRHFIENNGITESANHCMETIGNDSAYVHCLICGDAMEFIGLPVEDNEVSEYLKNHQCITQELVA